MREQAKFCCSVDTSAGCLLPHVPWRDSTLMATAMRSPHQHRAQILKKLGRQRSARHTEWACPVCVTSSSPDLLVVLPKTLAASPKAASDGPLRLTRAAVPASRPKAARRLTACRRSDVRLSMPGNALSLRHLLSCDLLCPPAVP